MSGLTLRLQKHLERETAAGAVATLWRVADETGTAVRGGLRLEVIIPASLAGEGKRVDVEPGHWLVEATLPSGEILTKEVAVPSGEIVPVTLHASEHSPHEWLGWQHLLGNIEGKETMEHLQKRARKLAFDATVRNLPQELDRNLAEKIAGKVGDMTAKATGHVARELGPFLERYKLIRSASPPLLEPGDFSTVAATGRERSEAEEGAGEPAVGLCEGYLPLQDARAWEAALDLSHAPLKSCLYDNGSREEALFLYSVGEKPRTPGRDFAHVAWGSEQFAVSLPIPWPHTHHGGLVPVEMMVRLHPLEKAVYLGVAVLDSEFGTLAGLMTSSTLPKARIVVEQAHDLLFRKVQNPLAAAAGGYVLLATGGNDKSSEWHQWIENLQEWFPDLPDGAVLKASLRLLYPKNQSSYDEARESLFEAFNRGIPYYSVGVARLLDGLTLFPDDPEAMERMKLVQRVAQRLDLSQAFTVIRLHDKEKRA